jgi:hypothetical protein
MGKGRGSMKVSKIILGLALAGAQLTGGAPASAKDAAKIAISSTSKDALIIIKTPSLPPAPTFKTAYRLGLSVYDPQNEAMKGGPWGGKAVFQAQPKKFVDGYLMLTVKPGTWVFQDFSMQDLWALCFNGNSLQFDVAAGEVVYLGSFDATAHAKELMLIATMTGRTSTKTFEHFFDTVAAPRIVPGTENEIADMRTLLAVHAPRTTAPVRGATFKPARFGTGSDLFGMSRVCGGYYTGKAKPKAD